MSDLLRVPSEDLEQPPEPEAVVEAAAPPPVEEPGPPSKGSGGPWRFTWRMFRGAIALVVAAAAAALVSSLSVDLGPTLRAQAERAGSRQIERPLHIGKLSIRLLTGDFLIEDLQIDGLQPEDRPFFKAKRLELDVPWWSVVRRDLLVRSVVLTDWEMLVETFDGGRHNFPKFTSNQRTGPRPFTTTVQYVRASNGTFAFEDHEGATWSVVAPNIDLSISKLLDYRGQVSFEGGQVQIMDFEPMWANMHGGFRIDQGHVIFDRLMLTTDGAETVVASDVNLAQWPEQVHRVESSVHFARMREIFWADRDFALTGDGAFHGTFKLFKGGHELTGAFDAPQAGVNQFRFEDLRGRLIWDPTRFEVEDTTARFYEGRTELAFSIKPLGQPTPSEARFEASYADVNLTSLSEALSLDAIQLAGRATGRNTLSWPSGHLADRSVRGSLTVTPPAGTTVLPREIPPELLALIERLGPPVGPFDDTPLRAPVPIGGSLTYELGPEWIEVGAGEMATPRTFVAFSGRTAYGERSTFPFHVTSADWQESDRLLAAIMTASGASTHAIPLGGYGRFDGVMREAFRRPRIEGQFAGDRMHAWDVTWGHVAGDVVIENSYATVKNGVVTQGPGRIEADGRYTLGFPRPDGGEEINTRVRLDRWPVADLRRAFGLDEYPIEGSLSGDFHVYGAYREPLGFGRVAIEPGVAYREPFDRATAGVRLEGNGVRFDSLQIVKRTGEVRGAAFVGFDGTYSFESDGRRIPLESIERVRASGQPLTGLVRFSAFGKGTFEQPRYEVRGAIDDLFLADEGVAQVTGRLTVQGNQLIIDQLDAASPRLNASGTGRIALTDEYDAEITLRFADTSLDPYARVYQPRISPFTTAVAGGAIRITGELASVEHLRVDATIESLDLRLFDYRARNDGPMALTLDQGLAKVNRLRLVGEGTALSVSGDVRVSDGRLAVRAAGDANLGILQGLMRDLRSAGKATLAAEVTGTVDRPVMLGTLSVADGRLRHFALPHAIEELNGRLEFDAGGVRVNGLTGKLGGGRVEFGGGIGFQGFFPESFGLTAVGQDMRLRYPEGFKSLVDADLALRGGVESPVLSGTVTVRDALWVKTFDPSGASVFNLGGPRLSASTGPAPAAETGVPIRFDLRIEAPSSLRIENSTTRLVSSASLTLAGTYDKPLLFGRADIDRGDLLFEGHRYIVTRGAIDFANPNRIEPFFDIEAETRARVPGETYRVTFRVSGTSDRLVFDLTSDPPLPVVDILSLLFGDIRDTQDAELRALRSPELAEPGLVASRAARLLTSPLSSNVGKAFEQALGVDSVQITPSLGDISTQQLSRINPGARLTISKRISERMLLTLSRTLTSSAPEQVILLEYNQSDRLSWILTQNEDRTYAVDFRVRRVF